MEKQEFLKVGKALIEALPSDLVKRFNLHEGSYLKVNTGDDSITLQPVTETEAEAERQAAFQQMYRAMESVVKLEPNSFASDEEEEDWIAEQVKAQRKERRATQL